MVRRAIEVGEHGHRLAEIIKKRRRTLGLSLRDLSQQLDAVGRGIEQSGITRIEQGQRRVDVDDLVALSTVLRFPLDALTATSTCAHCDGLPLPGFTCNECGKKG